MFFHNAKIAIVTLNLSLIEQDNDTTNNDD